MKTRYFIACGILIATSLAATLVAYSYLPERVPMHWDAHGRLDGYGPRWMLLVLGPALMTAEVAVFALLPKLSPKRFGIESFEATYLRLMLLGVGMAGYLHAVVLWAAFSGSFDVSGTILAGISVLLVMMGNVMGKVRRNFFIGIRTPWTLASERVWYATHRLAGKTIVASGVASFAAALWGGLAGVSLWIGLVLAGVLVPVAYSFTFYKELERSGGLEGS